MSSKPGSFRFDGVDQLRGATYDVLVIGGGITGVALAWLATLSGRSVALVEREDFSSGSSSATQRIIHSGLRYLQNLDIVRSAGAIEDRRRFSRLAPHLVDRLEFALPLYGNQALAVAGSVLYRGLLRAHGATGEISAPRVVSRHEILSRIPEISARGLRGALTWEDGSVFDTERLVVAFARSAAALGAVVVNHVEAISPIVKAGRLVAVEMQRRENRQRFTVRSRNVVDCTGQWHFFKSSRGVAGVEFVTGLNILTKPLSKASIAFGVPSSRRGQATWFVTPWRGHSIVGTRWLDQRVDDGFSRGDLEALLRDFNRDFESSCLNEDDVLSVYCGRVPRDVKGTRGDRVKTLEKPIVVDHAPDGMAGAFSVFATKYTSCLSTAGLVLGRLAGGYSIPSCDDLPVLVGGDVGDWKAFREKSLADGVPDDAIRALGNEAPSIVGDNRDLRVRVRHAVEQEMGVTLSDVVLRRLSLPPGRTPEISTLEAACDEMSRLIGWNAAERRRQVEELYRQLEVR